MNTKNHTLKINTKDKSYKLDGNEISNRLTRLEIKVVAGETPYIKLDLDGDVEFEGTIYPIVSKIYCEKCNRLLGELAGNYEVICPECKELNVGYR